MKTYKISASDIKTTRELVPADYQEIGNDLLVSVKKRLLASIVGRVLRQEESKPRTNHYLSLLPVVNLNTPS